MGWNPRKDLERLNRNINKEAHRMKKDPFSWFTGGVFEQPKPPKPGSDPRLDALRGELTSEAESFRQGLPEYKKQRVQGLLPAYDTALDEGTRRTRERYGAQGGFYGGRRRKAESSLRSQLASQLAEAKTGINRESESLARQKEQAAASVGLDTAMQAMQNQEQYYALAMQNDIARRQAIGQLAQGIGYGVGGYYGNKQPAPGLLGGGDFIRPVELGSSWRDSYWDK